MSETQPTNAVVLGMDGQPTNKEVLDQKVTTDQKPTIETPPTDKKDEAVPSLLNQKDGEKKEGTKPEGAPEKYEAYKLPDGVELAEATVVEANQVFKTLGLSQTQAQQLVDFHVKTLQAAQDAPLNTWKQQQETWQTELKNHPTLGGKLSEVKATVSKAIDTIAGADLGAKFRQVMDFTGAGNNPVFAEVMYKLASLVTEGGHVAGGGPSGEGQKQPGAAPQTAAHVLYPKLP